MSVTIRPARASDDAALTEIDRATWSSVSSPSPRESLPDTFFDARTSPEDVVVAADGDTAVGYALLRHPTPVRSNAHVLEVQGLAVAPSHQRHGIARRLLDAAAAEARRRGARKLRLRVLAPNEGALALYAKAGFTLEGRLREEFLLDGAYVDDLLLARDLTAPAAESLPPPDPESLPAPDPESPSASQEH